MRRLVSIISVLVLLCSCYNKGQQTPDAWDLTEQQLDSISFYTTHHYTQNYNFQVRADSMPLIQQLPAEALSDMPVDTLMVYKNEHLVVADITTVPADTIDSIWVKVASDQLTFGWIHEHEMLKCVSPDDPISEFIDFFSDAHLLIFLAFIVVVGAVYVNRQLMSRQAKLVHFNDIASFYPSLLCLLVATSATLYSSIQLFDPEKWRHFYYHPTLNPFAVPLSLGLFLISVWAIVIHLRLGHRHRRRSCPRRSAPPTAFGRGRPLSPGTRCHLCRRLCRVQRLHLILYRLPPARCLHRLCRPSLFRPSPSPLSVRTLWRSALRQGHLSPLRRAQRVGRLTSFLS